MIQQPPFLSRRHRLGRLFVALAILGLGSIASSWAGDIREVAPTRSGPHERTGYSWPYAKGPYYGDSAGARVGLGPDKVITQVGIIDLAQDDSPFPPELTAPHSIGERETRYFFVQSEPLREIRVEIASRILVAGGAIVEHVSSGIVVARLNAEALDAIRAVSGLLRVEPYHPALKLHPEIGRVPLRDSSRAKSEIYRLDLLLWDGEDGRAVAEALTALGVEVLDVSGDQLRVEAHRTLLAPIAWLEAVRGVYETLPVHPLAEETTTTIQTGQYNGGATPFHDVGIDGGGGGVGSAQILMLLDTGIQLDAAELSDTRTSAGTPGPAHRKVYLYQTTIPFGGAGDLRGCDSSLHGGVTHGQLVAAVALGNASLVPLGYGDGFFATEPWGRRWNLDGVAPGALLAAYDGQVTPPGYGCDDPLLDTISPGDLYNHLSPTASALGHAYGQGARIVNLSWGTPANFYNVHSGDIDRFMSDNPDALVLVAAGDSGSDDDLDGAPDELSLGTPATTKHGLAIGASLNANDVNSPNSRPPSSSVGPATGYVANRIAPQLMAPGGEAAGGGTLGLKSEFLCRTSDNDQDDPVECDVIQEVAGTSFSAAAASGAALLVRDYFLQGFYPTGTQEPSDSVATISGPLVKAILAASADFMSGENLTHAYRWNNEQGYGRIQLDNALPLGNWPASPTGMIVHDTYVSDIALAGSLSAGGNTSNTFEVCNDEEDLRIVLAWNDVPSVFDLRNNLNLVVTSPSGKVYRGNYFTDDSNRDSVPDPGEDCPGIGEVILNGEIDEGAWNLPICGQSTMPGKNQAPVAFDDANPIEAVYLSPDPDGNGLLEDGECDPGSGNPGGTDGLGSCGNDTDCASDPLNPVDFIDVCVGGTQQTEIGTWEVWVGAGTPFAGPTQDFSLVIVGGACKISSVRWDWGTYTCAESARVLVTEWDDTSDFLCDGSTCPSSVIEDRTTLRVYDEANSLIDCEGPGCTGGAERIGFDRPDPNILIFRSDEITVTGLTIPEEENGSLDVRDGYRIEVSYDDNGVLRTGSARVDCELEIQPEAVAFRQYGQDSQTLVEGGCERAPQRYDRCVDGVCAVTGSGCSEDLDCSLLPAGSFEYGYPDRHMDAGELIHFSYAFASGETGDLRNASASLRCVAIDADSPAGCRPNGDGCSPAECGGECDPRRENNPPCTEMTILDSPRRIGLLPAGAMASATFAIRMLDEQYFIGTPTVELVLEITDFAAGKVLGGVAVDRRRLNVDEIETWYNTDYPTGGTVVLDLNDNEREDNPLNDTTTGAELDFRFETRSYGDLTAGLDESGAPVSRNQNLLSPWSFDGNDGGFRAGLVSVTDRGALGVIHNVGEDTNFNGIEDGECQLYPGIACYSFPTDPRCPGGTNCISIENAAGDGSFTAIHHNQKGGCGWQTKPPYVCTGDGERGCLDDPDCMGVCRRLQNEIVSTLEPCSGACPNTRQCASGTPNPLAPCDEDADCGRTSPIPGDCQTASQSCIGNAGVCDTLSFAGGGGALHTGPIGEVGIGSCDGDSGSQCEFFDTVGGTSGQLLWWGVWLTPVIEKVDQSVEPDGLPGSRIEITQWAWNQSIDLPDKQVVVTWELDTDLDKIFPVDLLADTSAFNFVEGPFGALTYAGDPDDAGGYSLFAPMARCDPGGGACLVDTDCRPGSCSGNPSIACHTDEDCSLQGAGTCVGAETCTQQDFSYNGQDPQANNRDAKNSCLFEGPGTLSSGTIPDLGLAGPLDDDVDDDFDGFIDEFVTPAGPIRNMNVSAFGGFDLRLDLFEDLYGDTGNRFQGAIGMVNFEGTAAEPANRGFGLAVDDVYLEWREISLDADATACPADGACATLEVASRVTYEGVTSIPVSVLDPSPYGRACSGGANNGKACEAGLGGADCPGGTCNVAANDCDLDGLFNGPSDSQDCNSNGTPDVVVLVSSDDDPGEIVYLDQLPGGEGAYGGDVAISALADSEGVVHVVQNGSAIPELSLIYLDHDDGTGFFCRNGADSGEWGVVKTFATVRIQACDVTLVETTLTDNGDADLFADSSETITLGFSVQNNCGFPLTNCAARLTTDSPEVECVKKGLALLGDLPGADDGAGDVVPSSESFVFRMHDTLADRTSRGLTTFDDLRAHFTVAISCTEIDATRFPQRFSLTLDLNMDDGEQTPTLWMEGFEGGGVNPADPLQGTAFVAENLDEGIPGNSNAEGLANADGWRCQYNDPDWINSANYDEPSHKEVCYPGLDLAQANAVFWQIDGSQVAASPDGGRAFLGSSSLYYGIFLGYPDENFTTPLSPVESVATAQLINLGIDNPWLSFWHQVSLADHRGTNARFKRSVDRGVVQIKLHDESGTPFTEWMNLVPQQNAYDQQAEDNFFNCTFDPVDDGNNEDDYFDPTDPERDTGPSSTCYPGFSWAYMGSTTGAFSTGDVGYATTPPAASDAPALGYGTWVESRVDLSEFRGRRARLRFLVTSLKASGATYYEVLLDPMNETDDGWWIDEVAVSEVLSNPAGIENDDYTLGTCPGDGSSCIGQCKFSLVPCTGDLDCAVDETCVAPCPMGESCSGPPQECGDTCTNVTANVYVSDGLTGVLNPTNVTVPAPGWTVTLDAAAYDPVEGVTPSVADACLDGALLFRFCSSLQPIADCDDAEATVLRSWTENAYLPVTPHLPAEYRVEVACSTDPSCRDSQSVFVEVNCPGDDGNLLGLTMIRAVDKATLAWPGEPIDVDVWTSIDIANSSELYGTESTGYPEASFDYFLDRTSIAISTNPEGDPKPGPDLLRCYLVKLHAELYSVEGTFYCNSKTWRSGGHAEIPEDPPPGGFELQPQSPIGRDRGLKNPFGSTSRTGAHASNDDRRDRRDAR